MICFACDCPSHFPSFWQCHILGKNLLPLNWGCWNSLHIEISIFLRHLEGNTTQLRRSTCIHCNKLDRSLKSFYWWLSLSSYQYPAMFTSIFKNFQATSSNNFEASSRSKIPSPTPHLWMYSCRQHSARNLLFLPQPRIYKCAASNSHLLLALFCKLWRLDISFYFWGRLRL